MTAFTRGDLLRSKGQCGKIFFIFFWWTRCLQTTYSVTLMPYV